MGREIDNPELLNAECTLQDSEKMSAMVGMTGVQISKRLDRCQKFGLTCNGCVVFDQEGNRIGLSIELT